MLEKAREIGQHCLSGALLDPRSMRELLPDSRKKRRSMPKSVKEAVYFLTEKRQVQVSYHAAAAARSRQLCHLAQPFVKWLGSKVEETGHHDLHRLCRLELLFDGDRVIGVRTDDKGVDKEGQQKSNFEPGYDLHAKVVILAEGPRGSLTKQLIEKFDLAKDRNPQTYGVGIKELWEVPAGPHRAGRSHLHHGLAADDERIRRRLDLRLERQRRVAGIRDRARLCRSAARSAARAAAIQAASFCRQAARRRQDDPLRREVACLTADGGRFRRSQAMAG